MDSPIVKTNPLEDPICTDCKKPISRMVKHDCVRFQRDVMKTALEEILAAYLADANHCPAYKLANMAEVALKCGGQS